MQCQLVVGPEVDDGRDAAPHARWRRRLARLQGWLLPPRCVLCLDPGRPPTLDLCTACEADLPPCEGGCPRCAGPLAGERCPRCTVGPPPYASVLAPFRYAWPVDALVRGFKYHGRLAHGRVLGTLLAEAAARAGAPRPACFVPVPLHSARERERGYNQAWELARVAGRALGVPVAADLCVRTRETPAQATLDAAARRANLAGAFAVRRVPRVEHVALVDDVLTTGATLAAVAEVLLAAGVRRVDAWAVARA